MEVKEIKFEHHMSAHCENGVTGNLLRYYGINLSEPMVFGLGSGLFFTFIPFLKFNGAPISSFRPLPGHIFRRLNKVLGIKMSIKRFPNKAKESTADLDRLLAKGIPVGMVVGVFNLEYFPPPMRFHFNAHNIVVFGKKDNKYLVSDPVMEGVETITVEELELVRYSKGTLKPKGKRYHVNQIPDSIDLKPAIKKAIRHTAMMMTKSPGPIIGYSGIYTLSKHIRKWPKKHSKKIAARYLASVIRMQEEIGTGGAGFRFLYAAFLQEASKELNSPELNKLSEELTAIGDLWRQFAIDSGRVVKNRPQNNESYDSVADQLIIIGDLEKVLFKKLFKIKL